MYFIKYIYSKWWLINLNRIKMFIIILLLASAEVLKCIVITKHTSLHGKNPIQFVFDSYL